MLPRLPDIKIEADNASSVSGGGGDDDDSDEEIEVLIRRTQLIRHSKSAHASLSSAVPEAQNHDRKKRQSLTGYGIKEEDENASSPDSDEEFYVHEVLKPFRKSKSTSFARPPSAEEFTSLGVFKASCVPQILQERAQDLLTNPECPVAGFLARSIEFWPPPDAPNTPPHKSKTTHESQTEDKDHPRRRHSSKAPTDEELEHVPFIPFGRTASAGSEDWMDGVSVSAWSAPAQVTDDCDSDSSDADREAGFAMERLRSWSATERVPTSGYAAEVQYSSRKGISISDDNIAATPVPVDESSWKRHLSADDVSEFSEDDDNDNDIDADADDDLQLLPSPSPPIPPPPPLKSTTHSDAPSREHHVFTPLLLPPTPTPTSTTSSRSSSTSQRRLGVPNSKSESQIAGDRPRTPLFGQRNPENTHLVIADPDHPLVGSRSNSCFGALLTASRMPDTSLPDSPCRSPLVPGSKMPNLNLASSFDPDDIPMADDSTVESPMASFVARKMVLRRASPPIASEDDLSDIEMSEFMTDSDGDENTEDENGNCFRVRVPLSSAVPMHQQYNLSGMRVRRSASDTTFRATDESVGNSNYWKAQRSVPRSSTTAAMFFRQPNATAVVNVDEPVYENLALLRQQQQQHQLFPTRQHPGTLPLPLGHLPSSSTSMAQSTGIRKSATSVGFQGSSILPMGPRRRILPPRPDFAPTPEEPPEYANLPCSVSYHDATGLRRGSTASRDAAALCFFPTTSYHASKDEQHRNFARIQAQMQQQQLLEDRRQLAESQTSVSGQPQPQRRIHASSSASFTALTLADELENEKRGVPPETMDPALAARLGRGDSMSSDLGGSTHRPHRRTLPPLPVEPQPSLPPTFAVLMSQQPALFPAGVPRPLPGASVSDDHQICYGIDASMIRSTSNVYGMEDSYYEDSINGNYPAPKKSSSAYNNQEDSSGVSSCCTAPESANPTHRAQSSFVPRHDDEIQLEIGDAVHVERECDDHWCYGTNLRSGFHGIFPAAHVCEIDLVDEICTSALSNSLPSSRLPPPASDRDTFYLTMLASIEVAHHKGNDVLTQSINKVCALYQNKEEIVVPQTVLMEISFRGIHIIDKRRKDFFKCPSFDFFYSLQNISFCGAHPKQLRYFGFITKHPLLPRFACHVFLSNGSTQPIVESIGRAFKRSYDEYMAFAHPTEDIYIE